MTGGWVIGSLASDESWCRIACQDVGMIIIDVDYRLAPEYPFPVQIWDSWAALKWVFANAPSLGVDVSRVSIGGLSAGGHLSAVLAQCVSYHPPFHAPFPAHSGPSLLTSHLLLLLPGKLDATAPAHPPLSSTEAHCPTRVVARAVSPGHIPTRVSVLALPAPSSNS